MGNKPIQDCGFFLFGTGNPRLHVVVDVLLLVRRGPPPIVFFVRFLYFVWQFGGFLIFTMFLPLLSVLSFP